jgi:hypothetical protein
MRVRDRCHFDRIEYAINRGRADPAPARFCARWTPYPDSCCNGRAIRGRGRFAGCRLRQFKAAGMNAKVDVVTQLDSVRLFNGLPAAALKQRIVFDAKHGFITLRDVEGLRAVTRQDE